MDKIKTYFTTKAISNSLLGALFNPKWIKFRMDNPDTEDEEKSYFRIGSALDCLLTSPERWNEDFVVVDVSKPYGLMGKFIDNLPSGLTSMSDLLLYQEAYDKAGYKMSLDKVVDKLWTNEELVKYYKLTNGIKDSTVLSSDEFAIVNRAVEAIKSNPYTHKYFYSNPIENTEILHQVPVYFKYKNKDCKALFDGILIDHDDKTIQLFDLKTIGKSVYDFEISYLQFGYYRQAAFYTIAAQTENSPVYKYLQKGYKLLDFIFIVVENKTSSSTPSLIYRVSPESLEAGKTGGVVNSKKYKGVDELLDDYEFHITTNKWELPRSVYENDGIIELTTFDKRETETI